MLNIIMTEILGTPAALLGIFALVGLLLQKKPITDVVSGTLKTIMGFIIIGSGATILIASLDIFSQMFDYAFNVTGIIPNNEVIVAAAQNEFGTATALIMILGMVFNIILAKYTPFKYIFLTGHHTLFMACLIAVTLSVSGLQGALLILLGSLILGICMVIFPAMIQPFVRKITGSDDFAIGHFGTIGYLASAYIGKWFGNTEKTTEEIKVPKSLGFLRDTTVALSITMSIFFIIVALFAGQTYIEEEISNGSNFLIFSFTQALYFSVGVYIVLTGVRMLIAEIVPAFKGIAEKLAPNTKPALDCPTIFPFAPNAVIVGFLFSFMAGLLSMFILPFVGLAVIVPGLVPHFFTGATAGVFGNATGGRRGAAIGAFANGLIISFIPAILLVALGNIGFEGVTFGDSDFGVVGIIIILISSIFN